MSTGSNPTALDPQFLLAVYGKGYFPMADENGNIGFHDPDPRAVFPLGSVRMGKHMRRIMRSQDWQVKYNTCFADVMEACADRKETWITKDMVKTYTKLHHMGHAHSVEVFLDHELVGGLYGVSVGAAFFGESMFNKVDDAAKVAFHGLVDRLRGSGFRLLDSQYLNPFTASLGAINISAQDFHVELEKAVDLHVRF